MRICFLCVHACIVPHHSHYEAGGVWPPVWPPAAPQPSRAVLHEKGTLAHLSHFFGHGGAVEVEALGHRIPLVSNVELLDVRADSLRVSALGGANLLDVLHGPLTAQITGTSARSTWLIAGL